MDSAAITDHGVMFGVIDFYREAKAAGINQFLDVKSTWRQILVLTKTTGGEDRYHHLVLLAENNQG